MNRKLPPVQSTAAALEHIERIMASLGPAQRSLVAHEMLRRWQ
jgi:hypothetical protein